MRRFAPALALLAVLAATSGCAGPDGQRAQELLARADQALAEAESFRLAARVWMETPVGNFTVVLNGGLTTKKGGAAFLTVSSPDVPEFPAMTVLARGSSVWIKEGRRWTQTSMPESEPLALDGLKLTPYVKNVKVSDGHVVGGEPAVKIVGVFDTSAFLGAFLTAELGGAVPAGMLGDVSSSFEDTRVVIFLSEITHFPLRMLVDVSAEEDGEEVGMHLDLALLDVNEPIRIPRPRG
jgi:hypothetical protein